MQYMDDDQIKAALFHSWVRAVEGMDKTALDAVLWATGSDPDWQKCDIIRQLNKVIYRGDA